MEKRLTIPFSVDVRSVRLKGLNPLGSSENLRTCLIVSGALSSIKLILPKGLKINIDNKVLQVTYETGTLKEGKRKWGLFKKTIVNSWNSASIGFTRRIFLSGVGYKFQFQDGKIHLSVGRANSYSVKIPSSIKVKVLSPQLLVCWSTDLLTLTRLCNQLIQLRPGSKDKYNSKGLWYF